MSKYQNRLPHLSDDEILDPERVFSSLFDTFNMEEIQQVLMDSQNLIVANRFPKREYSIEEDNLRLLFEKLIKTLEAASIMRR